MKIPSCLAPTCLATVEFGGRGQAFLHALKLRSSGQVSRHQISLSMNENSASEQKRGRTFFRNQQIVHLGEPEAHAFLETLGCADQGHSLPKLLSLLPSVGNVYDLDEIADRQGLSDHLRKQACVSAETRLSLMQNLWATLLRPSLSHLVSARPARPIRAIDALPATSRAEPLPAPPIPDIAPPVMGWRTSRWGAEEARDCALRFTRGTSLEQLSRLIRRSPRSIHARLYADGIIARH